ncbi:DUF3853 family protein [Chryseobacterium sp. B21-037]|uniref:DUF3853 family protein n=1 Tax=Chryseobacterium sp. B21-037 TaxID=2926038 RepID=UPI0023583700|nr:DUF3853 family protein [Chryseobacterium sp. B21-037]MDC8105031.1 DUF3853 family protein [Chryseobacterium sp. B21-037]
MSTQEIKILKRKLIWQMTGDELITLLKYENIYTVNRTKSSGIANKIFDEKYVYGLKGIAKLLGCSVSSAMRLKKSGKINEAIIQDGRKIIVDVQKTFVLLNQEQSDT